ncbi:uncharacterized protein CTHT_0069070 [Thermochaetoides thermophila DSM 1495]|uniref:Uncharacterized protein n=1 Tax=Chaetomium thermophilum (strain DSM 1495 / CBS 144.50 / IMI 039719) TaxID=759272 RepID=G0SH83_CHATD|nr:hypothetical protein CTHT_0069070 [Thermochaetoides thermophila DSM 1495]EGS17572.1 hypothetical protein CTHT_0069070 [Thermochaetoides thermophila DSM 1495]
MRTLSLRRVGLMTESNQNLEKLEQHILANDHMSLEKAVQEAIDSLHLKKSSSWRSADEEEGEEGGEEDEEDEDEDNDEDGEEAESENSDDVDEE